MTIYTSNAARDPSAPSVYHMGDVSVRGSIALGTTALTSGDILELVRLPADHVPVGLVLDSDVLDSNGSPAIAADIGFISGLPGDTVNARTVGQQFGAAVATFGRTAAGEINVGSPRIHRVIAAPVDRSIGLKLTTAPGTAVVQGNGSLVNNRGVWAPNTTYAVGDYITLMDGAIMRCTTAGKSDSARDSIDRVVAYGPDWNIGFNLTTQDGAAVWTCITPVIGLTVRYRPARPGF
jgi:hypothetical protein